MKHILPNIETIRKDPEVDLGLSSGDAWMKWSMLVTLRNYCKSTTPVRLSDTWEAVRFVSFEVCGKRDVGTDTSEVSSRVGPISDVYKIIRVKAWPAERLFEDRNSPRRVELAKVPGCQPIHPVHCSSRCLERSVTSVA